MKRMRGVVVPCFENKVHFLTNKILLVLSAGSALPDLIQAGMDVMGCRVATCIASLTTQFLEPPSHSSGVRKGSLTAAPDPGQLWVPDLGAGPGLAGLFLPGRAASFAQLQHKCLAEPSAPVATL